MSATQQHTPNLDFSYQRYSKPSLRYSTEYKCACGITIARCRSVRLYVSVIAKRMNGSRWFWARRLPFIIHRLMFQGNSGMFKIRILPYGNLSQVFATALSLHLC